MPTPLVNGALTEQALRDIAALREKLDDFQDSRFTSAISMIGIIVVIILAGVSGVWGITLSESSERNTLWREITRVSEVQKGVLNININRDADIKDLEIRMRRVESLVGKNLSSSPP